MEEYKIKVAKYKATRDNIFNITIIFNNFVNIPEGTYEVKECCGFDDNGSYLSIKPSTDKISRTNDVKRCTTANGHSRFMFTQKHDYFDDYIVKIRFKSVNFDPC